MKRSVCIKIIDSSQAVVVEFWSEDNKLIAKVQYYEFDFAVAQTIEDFIFGGEVPK